MRALEQLQCFSKNGLCDLDLCPRTLKLELVQDIIIFNICVIYNINRFIKKGATVMTVFLKVVTVI